MSIDSNNADANLVLHTLLFLRSVCLFFWRKKIYRKVTAITFTGTILYTFRRRLVNYLHFALSHSQTDGNVVHSLSDVHFRLLLMQ